MCPFNMYVYYSEKQGFEVRILAITGLSKQENNADECNAKMIKWMKKGFSCNTIFLVSVAAWLDYLIVNKTLIGIESEMLV